MHQTPASRCPCRSGKERWVACSTSRGDAIDGRGPVAGRRVAGRFTATLGRSPEPPRPRPKCFENGYQGHRACSPRSSAAVRPVCSAVPVSARRLFCKSSIARIASAHGGYSVFAGVGERTREGTDLWLEMQEAEIGTDRPQGHRANLRWVFGQMNEPPAARVSASRCRR